MPEYKTKNYSIINGLIIIAIYFIFKTILTVSIPILSMVLRLYTKDPHLINDSNKETLKDS